MDQSKIATLVPDEFKDGKFLSVNAGDKFIIILDETLPPSTKNVLSNWCEEVGLKAIVIRGRTDEAPPILVYKLEGED